MYFYEKKVFVDVMTLNSATFFHNRDIYKITLQQMNEVWSNTMFIWWHCNTVLVLNNLKRDRGFPLINFKSLYPLAHRD